MSGLTADRPWLGREVDRPTAEALADALGVPVPVGVLLAQRGIRDAEAAEAFLSPSLLGLHPPEVIPDLEQAIERILRAGEEGTPICVWGDYDVDGVTGTTILVEALAQLGIEARSYIPHRLDEGYGLNGEAIRRLHAEGVGLLITVDGGSNDRAEHAVARELGVDLVVTDHHPIEGAIPTDFPLVHPGRPDRESPSASLCGAAVAYKLAWGLGRAHGGGERVSPRYREFLREALALAALGTVADVVPLQGENRAIVAHGLRAIAGSPRPGLRALLEMCGIEPARLTATDIAFHLGPHLNAAGRMGEVERALELLRTRDPGEGREVAKSLGQLNRRRKGVEKEMVQDCIEELETSGLHPETGPLLFAREGWHSGVAGIVAARVAERVSRPVFVVALGDGVGRGSGRSIPERPLTDLYDRLRPHVIAVGGHACAGGITIAPDRIERLREVLAEAGEGDPAGAEPPPRHYDLALEPEEVTLPLARQIGRLAPFGQGNPEPLFRIDRLKLSRPPRLVGRNEEHMMLELKHSRGLIPAIWFRGTEHAAELLERDRTGDLALVGEISEDHYRGVPRLRLRVVDLCR